MLRFAVIGIGRMGKRHAFNMAHGLLKGVKLQGVCDIDLNALDWCKKYASHAHRYVNYKDMLANEQLDGVIIATPHYLHEEIAIYCINHDVNTLIEKPLCVTTAAAKNVIDVAEKHPQVKVGVSFNQRSNRMYKRAKVMLNSGKLGEIQRINFIITDWYRSQAYYEQGGWRATYNGEGGGCLINQCIHQLDVLQWLGGMPKSVSAICKTYDRNITVENDVTAVLDYGDYRCAFTASTHELKGTNRLEIACDKGRVVITSRKMTVYTHRSQKEINATTKSGYGFSPSKKRIYFYGIITMLADIVKGQQLRSLRAFANEVKGSGNMLAPVKEGLNAVELFNAIYLSSWKGQSVCVPIDDIEYEKELENKRKQEFATAKTYIKK